MGYRIEIDHRNCINCGICMDVCPVQAIDMSRPASPGVEAAPGEGPIPWLMEHPIQVGECVGCSICVDECPVNVISLETTSGSTSLAPRQGPITRAAEPAAGGWIPLSSVTRESLKRTRVSPFDGFASWRTGNRRTGPIHTELPAHGSEDAPCQAACPAGTDAGRYVGLIAAGRYDDAYAVAAEVNPFPAVCGWICTAPCELACRRGELDEPIAIRGLKRFAAEAGTLPPITPSVTKRSERVAIVGGGPAGMSAAYYLARLGYPVTVLEAMPVPGGMMAIGIPAYRLPRESLQAEIARIVGLGVELRLNAVMGRDFQLDDLERDYQAVFLATGAPRSRRLGVQGDNLQGVIPATRFLKDVNLGPVPRLTGDVAVVGGGSTAMDAARSAWRCGAASVRVLYRRGEAEMPAQAEEVLAARNEGIQVLTGVAVSEVIGRDGSVIGLRLIGQAPSGEVEDRREVWAPVPGSATELAVETVLVADRGGARSVDPAGRRRDRDRCVGRDRDECPDPGHGPSRGVRRRRRCLRTEDDHRCGGGGPSRSRRDSRVPRWQPERRGRDHGDGPLSDGPAVRDPARPGPASSRLPASPGRREPVVLGDPGGIPGSRGRPRGEPLLPVRRRGRLSDSRGPCRSRTGRPIPPEIGDEPGRSAMTPDQVSGLFDAGESFIEGTIAAALVALWLLSVALYLARPYMAANVGRFSLRLGADLWWIIYVALRDILLIQVFLASFIFLYPDVVGAQNLPITGGLAAVCAFSVLLMKLVTRGDADLRWYRTQVVLLGLGATLYIVPYLLGVQVTQIGTDAANQLAGFLVSSQNPALALPLCYLSGALVGMLALVAVIYNLRQGGAPTVGEES